MERVRAHNFLIYNAVVVFCFENIVPNAAFFRAGLASPLAAVDRGTDYEVPGAAQGFIRRNTADSQKF